MRVVLAATSGETEQLRDARPRIVLLDVGLQDRNSLRLAGTVKQEMADAEVIVMDLLPVHEEIAEFVNAGVAGFILKDATFEDFVATIRSVAGGGRVLPARMTGTLFSQIARTAVHRGAEKALEAVRMTPREREVIALIAEGMSNKEIAQHLTIASDTVKSHVRNVMDKLALALAPADRRLRAPPGRLAAPGRTGVSAPSRQLAHKLGRASLLVDGSLRHPSPKGVHSSFTYSGDRYGNGVR